MYDFPLNCDQIRDLIYDLRDGKITYEQYSQIMIMDTEYEKGGN